MIVTLELRPEIAAGLTTLAAERGMSVEQYVRRLLEEQIPLFAQAALSPAERAAAWRESVKGLPHTLPLSDEAISRKSIYDARG